MKIIFDERQLRHQGAGEFTRGQLLACFESPLRIDAIVAELMKSGFAPPVAPRDFGLSPILKVHDATFVTFLQTAWLRWVEKFGARDGLPWNWPTRTMPSHIMPETIEGQMAYYAIDAGAPITANTWESAYWSAQTALEAAASLIEGQDAFASCRPPGHHAAADCYGAYCYLNNAAIAAQSLLDQGMQRVAILDVDYHHGNGTQSIFYHRNDVVTASLHGDPKTVFPYFSGHAHENGTGKGLNCNLNVPLVDGTTGAEWLSSLDDILVWIVQNKPDAIVVALGLDTAKGDPVSTFLLEIDAYEKMGQKLAALNLPTLFVLEGGYALDLVGACAAKTVSSFQSGKQSFQTEHKSVPNS
jgi:acetoin utilization deacetylase AcuC-like enzyme